MKVIKINNSFYCIAANEYDYETFIDKIKEVIHAIKGSFAYNYSLLIFSRLFRYADDLRKNYEFYYEQEYDSFYSFLYNKEMFDNDMLSGLYIDESHTILKLNSDLNSYNITNLFDYDDNNLEVLNEVLEAIYI